MPESIIIIGAGVGGLAAAVRLAQAGYDVTVLEKNRQPGGMLFAYQAGGFRWDIAPAPFYSRAPLEALFDDVGRDMADYLRLVPVDPQTRYFFPDGGRLDLSRDWARTAAQIAPLHPDAVAGALRFLAYAADLHRMRGYGFTNGSLLRSWLRAGPLRSAYGISRRFVRAEKLRHALASCAAHSGGSPFDVPAAFSELAHAMLNDGLWVPRGGLSAIPAALQKLAEEFDVTVRLDCPVKQIVVEGGRATGVRLAADSDFLPADAVLSNLDAIATARHLLPEHAIPAPALRSLLRTPMSSSAFVMLLGVRGTFPQLAPHNIFFSEDYRAEFEHVHRRALMPDDPTIALNISCKIETADAPFNQENWLIQVVAPPLSEKIDWTTQRAAARDRILSILERRYGLDLRDSIRIEKHLTPVDLQRMTGAWRGALHGELPHGRQAALARPQIRSRHIKGLYHVGGSVLPGGGSPQALLSAKAAVALLRRDLR